MFSKATMNFLVDISLNNNREWFDQNRQRYEDDVREPAFAFIRAIEPHLHAVSPKFTAIPTKSGGSLIRIFRDTRFGKDKTPYKTNVGLHFRHEAGKDVHAPGFYVHLGLDECFVGIGIWAPDGPTLAGLRQAIVDDPDGYVAARDDAKFRERFALSDHGDSLKTAPRGVPKDHPLIEDLRRKHHTAMARIDADDTFGAAGVANVADLMARTRPYARFMTLAAGQPF